MRGIWKKSLVLINNKRQPQHQGIATQSQATTDHLLLEHNNKILMRHFKYYMPYLRGEHYKLCLILVDPVHESLLINRCWTEFHNVLNGLCQQLGQCHSHLLLCWRQPFVDLTIFHSHRVEEMYLQFSVNGSHKIILTDPALLNIRLHGVKLPYGKSAINANAAIQDRIINRPGDLSKSLSSRSASILDVN